MANLRRWSTTATGNASVAGGANTINFAEGQAPSTVNNSAREMMAQIRGLYTPSNWAWVEHSATASVVNQTSFKLVGNQTSDWVAGRRWRLKSGSSTRYGNVVSSSYTTETTITVSVDTGSLSASHSLVALAAIDENSVLRRGIINVRDYGATGNGTTDDTSAIQSAINAANTQGGGEVFIPPGTYRCKNVIMKSRVTLRGQYRASILKLAASAILDDKVISTEAATAADGCAVINLEIDGNCSTHGLTNNQMNAITIQGDHFDWLIDGCYLHNTGGDGVFVSWADNYATQLPENIRIVNCTIENTSRQSISIVHCRDYVVANNICSGVIDLEPGNDYETNQNGSVIGNSAQHINAAVITGLAADDNNLVISGNTVTTMTSYGGNNVTFSGNTIKGSFRYAQSKLVTVIGNTMRKVESIVSNGEYVTKMVFSQNCVSNSDSGSAAITLRNITDFVADGNVVVATGASSRAVLIDNLDSSTSTYRFTGGRYSSSAGDVFYINSNTQVGCAVEIQDSYLDSTSNYAVNKDGSSAGGTLSVIRCTCKGRIQVNYNDGLFEVRSTRFVGNTFPYLVNNNVNSVIILDDLLFNYSSSVTTFLQNSSITSAYIGKMKNLSGTVVLDWTGSTGSPSVWLDGPSVTATSWYGTPPGTIKTGSKYNLVNDTAKRGQWYNGTSWVNIT